MNHKCIKAGEAVFKYELQVIDQQDIDLPVDAQILSVEEQHGLVMLWAVVKPSARMQRRTVYCIGTGRMFHGEEVDHIGTVQIYNGQLVFHFFIK